ncbi:N-acetylmuramidase/lysin [Streptococcus varani]|uniref:Lysozyme n=1 Tax=Streptococcus varani TaxID=1608583 RepID=A0A0E4CSQ8_9STRE|nr:N-acetylmuramidase/lysin [Streptococcus varani]
MGIGEKKLKLRKCMYLASLFASLICGHIVQADTIIAEPAYLILQGQSEKIESHGQFSVHLEGGQVQLSFDPKGQNFETVQIKIWTLNDRSDLLELPLELDKHGQFAAVFHPATPSISKKYFLEVEALDQNQSIYELKNYTFDWQLDPTSVSPQISEAETRNSVTTSETSSTVDTVSETPAKESSAVTAIAEAASGNLTIQNQNLLAGTFDIIISNLSSSTGIRSVRVPVWTEENGQDDLQWYNAERQLYGSYRVSIDKKNHKNGRGSYQIHLYYVDNANKTIGVASTQTTLSTTGKLSIRNVNYSAGTFDVVIEEVLSPNSIQSVRVPVWTSQDGQDDIRWYTANQQADGSYKVTVDKKNHKNGSGEYNVHLYYDFNNAPTQGIAATKTSLSPPTSGTISVSNLDLSKGSFDLTISNVNGAKPLKAIKVPVWTEEKGQDDLKWYNAQYQSDGSYKVTVQSANHKNGLGVYQAHLYYQYSDGSMEGIGTTSTSLSPQGKIEVANLNHQAGSFDLVVSNVSDSIGIDSIKVPVWTEAGGQDDIRWYTASKQSNGTYKVRIEKSNHKNESGVYHAHLYYEMSNGQMIGVTTANTRLLNQSEAKLSIENIDRQAGTFEVLISQVIFTSEIQSVRVPVWTETGGQDDIQWYEATRQNDGSYRVKIDSKNHKNGRGNYQVHLYFNYKNGKSEGIRTTQATLPEALPAATMSITNQNSQTGSFDVIINNITAPKGLQSLQIPVWSDKDGQDDIQWYTATKQVDGSYKVSVEAKNHKYDEGTYHIHLYLRQDDGSSVGLAQTRSNVTFSRKNVSARISIQNIDNTYGYFDVAVSDVFAPAGVSKVQVPVWSEVNGQNDIIWYEAYRQANGNYHVTVRLGNHRYETGTYHAHAYIESNGQTYGVGATNANVNFSKKSGQAFVDVSSHNGYLSVADYNALKVQGLSGVVVKLTEGTSYFNPLALDQIKNAQAADLKVSVYHYSHFTSVATAQAEARYFVAAAKRLGLPNSILMINDIEEEKSRINVNANMQAWETEMKGLGYQNLMHYAGASWIDVNGLGYAGPIQTSNFGISNFWIAQYPYINGMPTDQARRMAMHISAAAWQFTSRANLLRDRPFFDMNIDYTGRFTQ